MHSNTKNNIVKDITAEDGDVSRNSPFFDFCIFGGFLDGTVKNYGKT